MLIANDNYMLIMIYVEHQMWPWRGRHVYSNHMRVRLCYRMELLCSCAISPQWFCRKQWVSLKLTS